MEALSYLELKRPAEQPVYVLPGEEQFLQRLVLARITTLVLGEGVNGGDDMALSSYEGPEITLATVRDELETLPFISPRRLVAVRDADAFVTKYREGLERYVQQPSRTGVLVLMVKSWKANTRLAKIVPEAATITCEAVAAHRLSSWCGKWSQSKHQKTLEPAAASLLVELVGGEMGILDQELAKLATYVGNAPQITAKDVDALVAHSRVETAWKMLDAAGEGNAAATLATLEHLLGQGEEPMAILGAVSWQLRKLAQVARLMQTRMPLSQAMAQAALPPFKAKQVEQSLRRLGSRAFQLYDWLLDADLGMKSSTGPSQHAVLERLMVKLAG
jgi:DNA polymerase-3 subunit delta